MVDVDTAMPYIAPGDGQGVDRQLKGQRVGKEDEDITMSKKAFDKIAGGMREALAIARGEADPKSYRVHVPADVDVKAIRKKLSLSQDEFSARFGLPVATIRDWEQERRRPEGAARVLMLVIDREPDAVIRALRPKTRKARAYA